MIVDVAGATAHPSARDVWLDGDAGARVHVTGLAAWDSVGRALPARFVEATGGFAVQVDDAGARYPVDIDPVYEAAATVLTGDGAEETFGTGIAGVGDVDGDGYGDVVVGANYYGLDESEHYRGRVYYFRGGPAGLDPDPATVWVGPEEQSAFGGEVARVGDVNGDGYADFLVTAPYIDSVYVYMGSAEGPDAAPPTILSETSSISSWGFGYGASGAGDVDGDGFDDVIVGGSTYTDGGKAFLYRGSATGLVTEAAHVWEADAGRGYFGHSVAGARDVNGDGYDDVLISDGSASDDLSGRVLLYLGGPGGPASTPTVTLTSRSGGETFGSAIDGVGDVNGDGYDDVLVAGPHAESRTGHVYLYSGAATGLASTPVTLAGTARETSFGFAAAGAGDLDRDGFADVVVSAVGLNQTYIYAGSAAGIVTTPVATLAGETADSWFGWSVAAGGDVDADGYGELLVSAIAYDSQAGRAYLYRGYATGQDADEDGHPAETDCDDGDATVHPDATEICDDADVDEDCDGLADDADSGVTGRERWAADGDGDGYGDPDDTVVACDGPTGRVADATDCDDADGTVHPGADDVAGDGVDADCDGSDAAAPDDSGDDTADPSDPPDGTDADGGCGCAVDTSPTGWLAGLLGIVVTLRRRR